MLPSDSLVAPLGRAELEREWPGCVANNSGSARAALVTTLGPMLDFENSRATNVASNEAGSAPSNRASAQESSRGLGSPTTPPSIRLVALPCCASCEESLRVIVLDTHQNGSSVSSAIALDDNVGIRSPSQQTVQQSRHTSSRDSLLLAGGNVDRSGKKEAGIEQGLVPQCSSAHRECRSQDTLIATSP